MLRANAVETVRATSRPSAEGAPSPQGRGVIRALAALHYAAIT